MPKRLTPPNNTNLPKHGIYTRFVPLLDAEQMEGMDAEDLSDELAVARVHLIHSLEQESLATDEGSRLAWHREVRADLEALTRLKTRAANRQKVGKDMWPTLLEAVRIENERQKVKR